MTYGELFTPNPDPLSLVDETHSDDYYERDRGGGKDGRSSGVDSDRCREHGSLSLDEGCQRSAARPISSGGGVDNSPAVKVAVPVFQRMYCWSDEQVAPCTQTLSLVPYQPWTLRHTTSPLNPKPCTLNYKPWHFNREP
jgi:hypothetical protein